MAGIAIDEANDEFPPRGDDDDGYVILPGFDMFSRGHLSSPFSWLLPKPVGGVAQMLYAYENFVEQPLGSFRAPARAAGVVYMGQISRQDVFGTGTAAAQWLTPALLLLAIGQHFSEDAVQVRGDERSLHVGTGYMMVSPEGCWSNFKRVVVPCFRPPADPSGSPLRVSPHRTDHPVARAVMRYADDIDPGALWALNVVVRGLQGHLLSPGDVTQALGRGQKRVERAVDARASAIKAASAAQALLLEGSGLGVVPKLYDLLVPAVCGYWDFKVKLASPYRDRDRKVSPRVRRKWAQTVSEMVGELSHAN